MSALYPSISLTFSAMSDAVTQIHDDVVGDGHEMGEKHDIVGDWGDEDIVDNEIRETHDMVGENGRGTYRRRYRGCVGRD